MSFTYRVLLKPSDICYKKKLLPSSFDGGIPLRETLQQLANEEILIEDLPNIDVVWCQKKWVWYTLNNRRLWVFRELEKLGKCQYIATRRVETIEHVTDFLLYGSAELIGESNIVEWDDDGFRITLFNGDATKAASSTEDAATPDRKEAKEVRESKEQSKIPRDWREVTPLTVTVRWKEVHKSDADDERIVTPDPDAKSVKDEGRAKRAQSEESQRERKDSGYSCSSSGRTSPKHISDNETDYETVFSETELTSKDDGKSSSHFSKFERDRPSRSFARSKTASSPLRSTCRARSYSTPLSRRITTRRATKRSTRTGRHKRAGKIVRRPPTSGTLRARIFRRRNFHEELMFSLHHGGKSRLEQLAMKTKLMNTCGFCFKSFRAGVSLSQHIEELKHWACTRCGKYFESYTALGQHKLALDHCNVY